MSTDPGEFNFPGTPSLDGPAPRGYRITERRRVIAAASPSAQESAALFETLRQAVLTWHIQAGSRFEMLEGPARVAVGVTSRFQIPFGPLHPTVPCRVFEVVDEANRAGFGHGALIGHAQRGWESYLVERRGDGSIEMRIRVVARPAAWWMSLAGPAGLVALHLLLRRNLHSLDGIIAAQGAGNSR
ncbi:MAG: hypothetical protein JWQ43_3819 [Glaciihabitans sp.]|nr:hypothetical protein [Glaciihabitans sp.]